MKLFLPTLLLTSLSLSALASAEPPELRRHDMPLRAHNARPPSREQVAMRIMVRQLLLDRYDADHNLELDGEERHRLMADAHAARKRQALNTIRRFDTDGDGKLSPEEHEALQQAMEARRHDAPPNAEDTPPPHARQRQPHGPAPHGSRPPHPRMGKDGRLVAFLVQQLTMDAYDADRNGHLDRAESSRLQEDGATLYGAREAELVTRYDADKNGTLSESELQVALSELFPHPPHRHKATNRQPPPHHEVTDEDGTPPPPHHRRRSSINRLLDTHFDIDILLNLVHPPREQEHPATPCAPSIPSAS